MTTVLSPGIDTRDMRRIHRAFHREFGRLPGLVRAAGGDQARTRRVAAHLTEMLDLLHTHHSGEDRLLWPLLRPAPDERARFLRQVPSPARLAFRLIGQNQHRRGTQALRAR